jgi:DNA-binding NarL/FixJ family response regulator
MHLSVRERDVLSLVAEGKTNAEVGLQLHVSTRTVAKHLEHVYEKLGVHTRTAAAVAWLREDWRAYLR